METYKYKITNESHVGQRIDKLLSDFNKEWSRSQLQDWIKEGLVKVNEKVIKSNYKVKMNDQIIVTEKEVCLLYTSPSPRDQRGSRMPSSA